MPTPPLFDFDALLAPLPGDSPAGRPVPFDLRRRFEEGRKEVEVTPYRPEEGSERVVQPPDWASVVRLATEVLTATSKDLMTAARLTEALVMTEGFAGLRDGLCLLRRMMEECWDRMHPDIEDGDLEVRAAPFNWLDDLDRGALFPRKLLLVPVVRPPGPAKEGEAPAVSWQQWKDCQDGKKDALPRETIDRLIAAARREDCAAALEDLQAARVEHGQLATVLANRLGGDAPSLVQLGDSMAKCLSLAELILQRKGPAPAAAAAPPPAAEPAAAPTNGAAAAAAAPVGAAPRPPTREDIYRQLASAAALLQELEPHSPIPYLIQRAVELGALPFPKLVRTLIRDQSVITELNRELGIREDGG
jgi:type VI secretion system protein ImpA